MRTVPPVPAADRLPVRLADRLPEMSTAELLAGLVPPPRFAEVRFANYLADPAQPSQAEAVASLQGFAAEVGAGPRRFWQRRPTGRPGRYLDGGFGVGKTHLLASLWHEVDVPKAFGTFVEFTNLVGALGFQPTVAALREFRLVCIDEFELDDPGDTVLMSTLLMRLVESGVWLAATSNTLPDRLGEERFAADDFVREIQGLAAHFETVKVDGDDYRHRGLPPAPQPTSDEVVARVAHNLPPSLAGQTASLDDFAELTRHLARVHPSRFAGLVAGVGACFVTQVETLHDQAAALRWVVLADRLYDRDVPVVYSGTSLDRLFSPELLAGGYRKKYRRAVSRLVALSREGERLLSH